MIESATKTRQLSNFVKKINLSLLCSKLTNFGQKCKKVPNIQPKPNIRRFLAAEYSVLAKSDSSCFSRTLVIMSHSHISLVAPGKNINFFSISEKNNARSFCLRPTAKLSAEGLESPPDIIESQL
jgi:hypothetical protein